MLPPATEAEAEADTPPTLRRGQDGDEPDLQRLPDEASFAYDYATCLGFVTASALSDASHGGPLLRRVIAKRGVSALYVDEAHGVSADSMAYYNDALRDLHVTIAALIAQLASRGWPRPPIYGFTSTLTPQMAPAVRGALGMAAGAVTERCNIDRPELLFHRLPLPQGHSEPAASWLQRAMDIIVGSAPLWALQGGIIVFVPTAKLARSAGGEKDPAHKLRVPTPTYDGTLRQIITYLGTNSMSSAERASKIAKFEADPEAVLVTNCEAWSHGGGRRRITLVIHFEMPRGGVELWQRSGRGARLVAERALVVILVGSRLLVQRALFSATPKCGADSAMVETMRLCRLLVQRGCLRQHILTALDSLGQAQCPCPCYGCDACLRDGVVAAPGQPTLGSLPQFSTQLYASAAAGRLLRDVRLELDDSGRGGLTLTQLLAARPTEDGPDSVVFAQSAVHDLLVYALLAERSIAYRPVSQPLNHISLQPPCVILPTSPPSLGAAGRNHTEAKGVLLGLLRSARACA